jgi:hypothetical protein
VYQRCFSPIADESYLRAESTTPTTKTPKLGKGSFLPGAWEKFFF